MSGNMYRPAHAARHEVVLRGVVTPLHEATDDNPYEERFARVSGEAESYSGEHVRVPRKLPVFYQAWLSGAGVWLGWTESVQAG